LQKKAVIFEVLQDSKKSTKGRLPGAALLPRTGDSYSYKIYLAKNSSLSFMGSIYSPSLYTRMLPEAISSMSMTLPLGS